MTLQKKVDDINRKIEELKSQQQKIENDIALQIVQLIKAQSGFSLPFGALIGGLLEVIETCKADPLKMEEWHQTGEKFLKSKNRNRNSRRTEQRTQSMAKSA